LVLEKELGENFLNSATATTAYGLQGDVMNRGYTGYPSPNITTARGGRFRIANNVYTARTSTITNGTAVYASTENYVARERAML